MKTSPCLVLVWLAGTIGCTVPTFPEARYLALGDSITGDYDSNTYPSYLVRELDVQRSEFGPEGSGGRTVEAGLQRLQQIVEFNTYPNLETFIYFLGGADVVDFIASRDPGLAVAPSEAVYPFADELDELLADMRAAMAESLELAQSQGWTVYVATYYDIPEGVEPCPAFGNALSELEAARAAEYIALLNALIEELTAAVGATLVDLRLDQAELMSDPDHYADCLHPSGSGAQIIAGRFAQTLQP